MRVLLYFFLFTIICIISGSADDDDGEYQNIFETLDIQSLPKGLLNQLYDELNKGGSVKPTVPEVIVTQSEPFQSPKLPSSFQPPNPPYEPPNPTYPTNPSVFITRPTFPTMPSIEPIPSIPTGTTMVPEQQPSLDSFFKLYSLIKEIFVRNDILTPLLRKLMNLITPRIDCVSNVLITALPNMLITREKLFKAVCTSLKILKCVIIGKE